MLTGRQGSYDHIILIVVEHLLMMWDQLLPKRIQIFFPQ